MKKEVVNLAVFKVAWTAVVVSAAAGAIGGPMGFFAGSSAGAVELASPAIALACIGAGWAAMLPLLAPAAARLDKGAQLVEQST